MDPQAQVAETDQGAATGLQSPDALKAQAAFLDEITKEFKRLQQQKARPTGGVESRVLLNVCFGSGEHNTVYLNKQILSTPADPNKLNLVFNLIDSRTNKLIGRLCAVGGVYKANPDRRDPKAFSEAEIVDRMVKALDQKLDQPSRTREIMFWVLYGGTAFEYVPWVKNATMEPMPQYGPASADNTQGDPLYVDVMASRGQAQPVIVAKADVDAAVAQGRPPESFEPYEEVQEAGEVGSQIFGPLSVFLDQSIKSIEEIPPEGAVDIAQIKTQAWIEENYQGMTTGLEPDDNFQIVTTRFQQPDANASLAGVSLRDLIPVVQGSRAEDDPPMNMVIERYQPASLKRPHGRLTCFVPGKKILFDGDNPYEEIPLVDYHFKPVTTSFWTKDFVTDLIAPQRFLNKRMSQLGEQSNASIYDKILLGAGISEKDIPADYPGFIKNAVAENGAPLVQRLPGPQLPQWFMESIKLVLQLFDEIAGGADLMQEHRFPGQLRGPMAVPMLQEIIDTEWGPFFEHLGQRFAKTKQMRMNRVKQFYPPLRTMHYMDRSQRDEVFEFHAEKILRSGTNFNITVERGSLVPELRALREVRVRERLASPLSILYIDERTGRLDKSKIAADLAMGDVGRDSKEAQYRKLGAEIVGRLWRGEPVPPVQPFYDHSAMMDELEAAMATTEYMSASPPIQQAFVQRWGEHNQFLQQLAQQQAQAAMQGAVQQGVQQASAEAAAYTVKAALPALQAQVQTASGVPTTLQNAFGREQP